MTNAWTTGPDAELAPRRVVVGQPETYPAEGEPVGDGGAWDRRPIVKTLDCAVATCAGAALGGRRVTAYTRAAPAEAP